MSKSVQKIVVERLINKIKSEKRLPWQRPFQPACMNWYSKHEYRGINKLLLSGGEYITPTQLKKYNKEHRTNYWFKAGTPWEIVVFYTSYDTEVSQEEAERLKEKPYLNGQLFKDNEGRHFIRRWVLRYYRVYNIDYISDSEGNKLRPNLGNTVFEKFTPADKIVSRYLKASGVKVYQTKGRAYYTEREDAVYIPAVSDFICEEQFYRVLFHELAHSTGVESRLNRACFKEYGSMEGRSREELIAEVCSLLLASEAGFREDTVWVDNSENYIVGWIEWMQNHEKEVLNGLLAAEKAKNYILSGGKDKSDSTTIPIDGVSEGDFGEEL